MKIQSKLKEYEVILDSDTDFLMRLSKIQNAQFVIDERVYGLYEHLFSHIPSERLILLKAEEQNKVLDTALDICEKITEIPAKRNAVIVSIGGGIIQDITGFAANIIYRGIRWIFVPTTLLAACDSCIGGKTSLNYKKYKNLLGTFYPPDEIHICSQMFHTLTEKDFKSGLGEVIKFNIMAGEEGLCHMENNIVPLLSREPEIVNQFVKSSLLFKKRFIEIDEFDKGERIKLNFAHTFGHAIEVISGYEIPHGTAVAIGMIMANSISAKRGLMAEEIVLRIENVLLMVIDVDIELLAQPIDSYIKAIRKDKKQVNDSLSAVLISKYGDSGELSVIHDLTEQEVEEAIKYFIGLYKRKDEN
ncbi:MAG: 3-dehydroquinate synthase [Lachnospiraceae bacterium]|jgi:3-dehydroquinate synthase|nr:3-dehydroquinate synthase [Lachnospiraceae bacterium]